MSHAVRLTPETEQDLNEIRDWYSAEAPHVNPRFQVALDRLLRRICENPFLYPAVHHDLRRAAMHGFRYSVFYKVRQEVVHVLGVVHQARDPEVWKGRT